MDSSSDEAWTDRVDVGSICKFSRHICNLCGDSSFLHNPGWCSDCEHADLVAAIPCITFKHLLHTVNLPETVIDTLVSYLVPDLFEDSLITFRKRYLKKMLMGWPAEIEFDWTPFRMLTYHTNGMDGMAGTQDVLDLVLEFSHGAGYRPNRGYRELWGPR